MASQASSSGETAAEKQEMSFGRKFALITLTSAGVALFLTGRTAKALAKRMPKSASNTSEPPPSTTSLSPLASLRMLAADQASMQAASRPLESDWRLPASAGRKKGELKRLWERDFRSNRALQVEEARFAAAAEPVSSAPPLNFNPALHALGAFGVATILVTLGASATVWSLGRRWQLDGWEDWKMFARYGVRGIIEPLDIRRRIESVVPAFMKTSEEGTASAPAEKQVGEDEVKSWVEQLDEEWQDEKKRREGELAEWMEARRRKGLPAFGVP